jgi:phosphomannomutase
MSTAFHTPFANRRESIRLDAALCAAAKLPAWAVQFKLGTAGYRDLLDPADFFNLGVPFNALTAAVFLEARARLAAERGLRSLHVGGEVRPHTQELIDLAARIYAAHGLRVHLRPAGMRTTPIWLSSFGVFFEELGGGENFTASHSQSYKGGWKPMDGDGGQLIEMAPLIEQGVRALVATAASDVVVIELAAADDPLIRRDFDPVDDYVAVLRQVVPAPLLATVPAAAQAGFRAGFCTEGGSMAATARRVFAGLGLDCAPAESFAGTVFFTHEQEHSDYHGIGQLDGVNHGVDPGKWQVYKHVGAQDLLRQGRCDVFFIWDPDGDRFNMVTTAPSALAGPAAAAGLEIDPLDEDRCLVFFKPNQIYFMLTALRLEGLLADGALGRHDWITATTFPTSRSIGEVAEVCARRTGANLPVYQVPVGFKYFAELVGSLERQTAAGAPDATARDVTGREVAFGPRPRLLMMAEESGGAALGFAEPVASRHGARRSLAPKEKDAMQIGVLALCLAARLHAGGDSFAGWYLSALDRYETTFRFYERRDLTLFDESLKGDARTAAQAAGNARKEATVAFFAALEGREPAEVAAALRAALPAGVELPPVVRAYRAGDGTLIEFAGLWFELRASGTDAVLRYYMEGRDAATVGALNEAFTRLRIAG